MYQSSVKINVTHTYSIFSLGMMYRAPHNDTSISSHKNSIASLKRNRTLTTI